MTVQTALKEATNRLVLAGNKSPKADAWLLLSHIIGCGRMELSLILRDELDETRQNEFRKLIARRASGEPLQYITGFQGFMSHVFEVNSDVLIPRYDTETLASTAIDILSPLACSVAGNSPRVLDACTGSGVIAITIAAAFCGKAEVFGFDISESALAVARKNAKRIGVDVCFFQSDMFSSTIFQGTSASYDMIVSNPPYIPSGDIAHLDGEVRCEPVLALDGGDDGLDFYRAIIASSPRYLNKGGYLLLEIGYGQAVDVAALLRNRGFEKLFCVDDINGIERVIGAQWMGESCV